MKGAEINLESHMQNSTEKTSEFQRAATPWEALGHSLPVFLSGSPPGNLDFLPPVAYSSMMKRTVSVRLPRTKDRSYTILIDSGSIRRLPALIRGRWAGRSVFVVTDTTVGRLYGRRLMRDLAAGGINGTMIEVPPGEASKSIDVYYAVLTSLLDLKVRRSSLIVTLGGGVIGDLAGFVAATVLRGIEFIQVPTSLLAQVDSSVGGKVGIDHATGKNLLGAFHQPSLVVIDPAVLRTLTAREFRNGLAEIVKIAAALDKRFFRFLERKGSELNPGNLTLLSTVIHQSVGLKAAVVNRDERETGLRKVLNLGHTMGHAIESATGFRLRHGEAVALGLVLEGRMAVTAGFLSVEEYLRVHRLLDTLGLPTRLPSDLNTRALFKALALDKKAVGRDPLFVLLRSVGTSLIDVAVPPELIRSLVE